MATPLPPAPPSRRLRRSPPELPGDLIPEILLRLPPSDPECLVRCSAACKSWRRLLTGPAFPSRYRELHGVPPMLGVLFDLDLPRDRFVARFVRTTPFRPRTLDHGSCRVRDARHGRVLFHDYTSMVRDHGHRLVVWNPIKDDRWVVPMPKASDVSWDSWDAAVLCAAAAREGGSGCRHLDCHGGPFLVAFVGTDVEGITRACVYSSEDAAWSHATYADHPDIAEIDMGPCTLVGNTVYCLAQDSKMIVGYNLGRRQLAFFNPPEHGGSGVLMPAMGGGLGFASVRETCLYVWSRGTAGPDGTAKWTQSRAIELSTLPAPPIRAIGSADGLGEIFLRTDAGVFSINLKSERIKEVLSSSLGIIDVIPYTSFYTPDHATGRSPPPDTWIHSLP